MKKYLKIFLWVALIVFFGFRLRLIGIDKPSGLWFDEMIVYLQATGPSVIEIIKNASMRDILMPLYQLLLAFWMELFGNSDLTLRIFSAITGSLAIIGAYLTGAKAKDEKTGYIAALLLALNGCAIYFSQEVKFYILAMFFCSFNLYFFLRVLENQKDKLGWAGLVTSCILGCYTFSIYIFLAFVQFAYLFFENLEKKESFKYYWINSAIMTVLLLPFLWLNYIMAAGTKNSYASSTLFLSFDASSIFHLLQSWLTPFTINKVDNYIHYFDILPGLYNKTEIAEISVIMFIMLAFMIYGLCKNDKARKLGILFLSFVLLTSVAGMFLTFCLTVRYGVLFIPFIAVLTAIGIGEIDIKLLRNSVVTFLVVFLTFINVFSPKSVLKSERAGLKNVADIMQKYELGEKDIVFLPLSGTQLFNKYYKFKGMFINSTIIYTEVAYKSFGIKNSGDIKKDFREYLKSDKPTVGEKNFFELNIDTKEHKGHYVVIVKGIMESMNDVKAIAKDDNQYAEKSFYFLAPYKFLNNIIDMCEKKYGPGELYVKGNWLIYVYKIK